MVISTGKIPRSWIKDNELIKGLRYIWSNAFQNVSTYLHTAHSSASADIMLPSFQRSSLVTQP